MPPGRPKKDVESHKEFILHLHDQNKEYKEILRRLSTQRGFHISKNVLEQHLRIWAKKRYDKPECRDETLRQLIFGQSPSDSPPSTLMWLPRTIYTLSFRPHLILMRGYASLFIRI
ncbi:hypothetical protein HO173_011207 [Letharia columbiana]|uniref:Clr5 domain-containing protein n=1 Tax=Letharia columbiana TaxID=112416 RepID=A0A8H6FJW0_9LECA|nr:uncharacterized protein HO173_011207 [Letharia columbiana]KAF6229833.1 hypothetical protein HO173_011207 [Letharia columbiana]